MVRHQGREQNFHWSGEKGGSNVRWAPYLSGCEYEVFEVTSDNLVTLTHNLYATRKEDAAMLEPQQIELYTTLEKFLSEPVFCRGGK